MTKRLFSKLKTVDSQNSGFSVYQSVSFNVRMGDDSHLLNFYKQLWHIRRQKRYNPNGNHGQKANFYILDVNCFKV